MLPLYAAALDGLHRVRCNLSSLSRYAIEIRPVVRSQAIWAHAAGFRIAEFLDRVVGSLDSFDLFDSQRGYPA